MKKLFITLLLLIFMSSKFAYASLEEYETYIQQASVEYNVDADLIRAVMRQESGGNQFNSNGDTLESNANIPALGAMQIQAPTALDMGFTEEQVRNDVEQNIRAGTAYLSWLSNQSYIPNDIVSIAAAYNAGPGNFQQYGGVPPFSETINYVQNVAQYYTDYSGNTVNTSAIPASGSAGSPSSTAINTTIPSIYQAQIAPIALKFNQALGMNNADTLSKSMFYLLVAIGLFFVALQILFFWKEALSSGDNNRVGSFTDALFNSSRSFLAVVVLINLIAITYGYNL